MADQIADALRNEFMSPMYSKGDPVPAPAADDDVETVRKGLDDADDYIPTRCPDICDACSHDKGHPSCQRRYREHMEARDSIADAFRALDRLAARLAQQDETLSELDEVARDNQLDVMRNVMCRLPDVLVEGDWQLWYDAHRNEWLSEPRAFGGWIAQRLGDTLARLATLDRIAEGGWVAFRQHLGEWLLESSRYHGRGATMRDAIDRVTLRPQLAADTTGDDA